jgi:hypothetical protein
MTKTGIIQNLFQTKVNFQTFSSQFRYNTYKLKTFSLSLSKLSLYPSLNFLQYVFIKTCTTRLTTFCRSQNRTKKYKVPPFDNYKKIISQFCKQYTYSINLKVYLVFDFSFFNISLLFLTELQIKKILN